MLGENIKNLRKQKGYTQEELAIRLHVVRQTVSKWEKGGKTWQERNFVLFYYV